MTDAVDIAREKMLAELRPSTWMQSGINDPGNAVAVMAKKGGTSKTSFTAMALDACARFGLNALGIDVDPQGNLSIATNSQVNLIDSGRRAMGNKPILEPDRDTIVEVIQADADGVVDDGFQVVPWTYDPTAPFTRGGPLVKGQVGTIGILPAYDALEDIARNWNLADLGRLDRALNKSSTWDGIVPRTRWDIVFLDILPGGSDIARMGLKAAKRCLVVTRAEPFGMSAVSKSLAFATDVRDNWGHPTLDVIGLVLSAYRPRTKLVQNQMHDLKASKTEVDLWRPRIPDRVIIPTSQDFRAPISAFLPDRSQRPKATEVCQVAEALVLKLLHTINHPRANEIQALWEQAWPELSNWATGDLPEADI